MLRKKINTAIVCVLFGISSLKAQTDSTKPAPATTYTFSVDAYYRTDFANQLSNNKTSFTNSNNSFELGMASIRVDHSFGKVAATVDLGFGRRAEEFSYNDGETGASKNGFLTLAALKQAYMSYSPSSKIKFTVGKWATHVGWELLDAYANRNYSMSYGFSYGPFFHTGVKTDISLGGKSAFMIGIAIPTDRSTTTSSTKVAIAQFSTGTKDDKLKAYLNFQGTKDLTQFDLVLNGNISSKFAINYDGTVQSVKVAGATHSWSSNALYFNYDPTSKFGLTLRGEYFDDKKAVSSGAFGAGIFAATLSANVHLSNLTIIPEIRLDNASKEIFLKNNGAGTKSAGNFLIAAVYKF
ncbi:MAG: porin [Sphingobacteriales bacterium]|nr:MAG: porin [Sphingobacteriales bacterium]